MPSNEEFLRNLGPELHSQAALVCERVSEWYKQTGDVLGTSTVNTSNQYHCYPFLFREAFPSVSEQDMFTVALAGVFYLDHTCLLDGMIDEPELIAPHQQVLSTLLHEKSLHLLAGLFPHDSAFWQKLVDLKLAYGRSVLLERQRHVNLIRPFEEGEFLNLAIGKAGLSKASHLALAYLSDDFSYAEPLSTSQDWFNAAFQSYDDARDWKLDLKQGNYTSLLTDALLKTQLAAPLTEADRTAVTERLGQHLYYNGAIENLLESAVEYCARSKDAVRDIPCVPWTNLVACLSNKIQKLAQGLRRTRLQTVLRSRGFLLKDISVLIQGGLQFLQKEQANGYPEAAHCMGFLWDSGERRKPQEVHTSAVFQRAIIADVFLDAHNSGMADFTTILRQECDALIDSKLSDVRGGWNYFPSLDNLPPDADDLGQVLQVLVRAKDGRVQIVDEAINLLLDQGTRADGSFETWIVDYSATDPVTQSMINAIQECWGDGSDVEVVANLAFALWLYDRERFSSVIERAVQYIEREQDSSGLWHPTWYSSAYYGTYAAVRFLAAVAPGSPVLASTVEHVCTRQHSDGGFGSQSSTPLETALSILIAHSVPLLTEARKQIMLLQATQYLSLTVREDQTWDATNFIKMDLNRARRKSPHYAPKWLYYKSRSISTAYAVKALLCVRNTQ